MIDREDIYSGTREAVRHFWKTRARQQASQGKQSGRKDYGARSAVTGGKQLDGFAKLVADLVIASGLSESTICRKKSDSVLPGYFRPTKEWDLLVVHEGQLLATIEFKSQIGPSFGNNFNNRTEEAIGSATDLLTAYREGALRPSPKPWVGYFLMLENCEKSSSPVSVSEPHFHVFEEFRSASYIERYQLFCLRLVRERLYDAAGFITTNVSDAKTGEFAEPDTEISVENFCKSLFAHLTAAANLGK